MLRDFFELPLARCGRTTTVFDGSANGAVHGKRTIALTLGKGSHSFASNVRLSLGNQSGISHIAPECRRQPTPS
jgi:hypothetical protein